ncbi:MAG: HlyD family secretion protein [Thermodesulfobacteriota bacterium]
MSLKDFVTRLNPKSLTSSVRFWVLLVVCIIIVLIFYYVLLDRYTPYTSDAFIQTYVLQVAPQVDGRVVEIYVGNNEQAKKGQKLFSLDPRPYEYQAQQLRAKLVQTRQNIDELNSDIAAASEVIKQAEADLAYANEHYGDLKPLAEKNYVAKLELDKALQQVNARRATLNQARADFEKARQALEYKIDDEYAIIKEAESSLALAEYDLEQTVCYAPSDGYVTNLQLVVGSYIKAGDAVLTFVDDGNWRIVANFRENSVGRIKPGQEAEVSISLYPGKIFKAVVESTDWGVLAGQGVPSGDLPMVEDAGNWVRLSQRFPVRLRITDMDHEKYELRIGGSASVAVFTGDNWILNPLARLWLRIGSIVDYVY